MAEVLSAKTQRENKRSPALTHTSTQCLCKAGACPGETGLDTPALPLARIYEGLPLRCVLCGSPMRIIVSVTDAPVIHSISTCRGHQPTAAPELAPARGPPLWGQAALVQWDDTPPPMHE